MSSIAKHTYPQVVWRNGIKKLWNPIQRKALKNRPEERVRLRIMESLVRSGWSKHRISTEESVGALGDASMRTDIICYSGEFEPRLLVECKAEYISISSKTAEQVARYNRKVKAPYVLMTNGVKDYWYVINKASREIRKLEESSDLPVQNQNGPTYAFEDWRKRGFAGKKASQDLRRWFKKIFPAIWLPEEKAYIRFLCFGQGPADLDLDHYYRIVTVAESRRLALTTLNTAYGGNRLVAILNEEDENEAVMEINLGLLFDGKKESGSIYSKAGVQNFDPDQSLDLPSISAVDTLADRLNRLFVDLE